MMEDSVLEVAEAALEAESKWKRRKRKRKTSDSSESDVVEIAVIKKKPTKDGASKKRRRIVMMNSSDSSEDERTSVPVKNNEVQTRKHLQESSFNNLEKRECFIKLKDFKEKSSLKANVTTNIIDEHVNLSTPYSSKAPVASPKANLNFSDWDFDNVDIFTNLDVRKDEDKSNQGTVLRNKNETINSSPVDKYFSESNFCNFELADLDVLMTSPVLSSSGSTKKSGSRAVRSLNTEFHDEVTKLPIPCTLKSSKIEGGNAGGKNNYVQGSLSMFGFENKTLVQSSVQAGTSKMQVSNENVHRNFISSLIL